LGTLQLHGNPLKLGGNIMGNRLRKKKPKTQHPPTQSTNKFMGAYRIFVFIFIFEQANIDWPLTQFSGTTGSSQ